MGSRWFVALSLLLLSSLASCQGVEPPPPGVRNTAVPLAFEPAQGHDSDAAFIARGEGYAVQLGPRGAVMALHNVRRPDAPTTITLSFPGSQSSASIQAEELLPGVVHYLHGNDAAYWRTGVQRYARVRIRNLYRGIDLVYYWAGAHLEYDFLISPGADPSLIRLAFQGASVSVDSQGDLLLQTKSGTLRHARPRAYVTLGTTRQSVPAEYSQPRANQIAFRLGSYDPSFPLIIDPVVQTSFLGGNGSDGGARIALDGSRNIYIAGTTFSSNFPGTSPQSSRSHDAYVAMLDPSGTTLVYAVYLGGSGRDEGRALAVDASGNAYVTGTTFSKDFPTTPGAYRRVATSTASAFAAKLSPTGGLVYSTYVFQNSLTIGRAIGLDASGNAYIAGAVSTPNGDLDCLVAALNATGTAVLFQQSFGGQERDIALAISTDTLGSVYVTGETASPNFPTTSSAFQRGLAGGTDAFAAKLAPDGSLSYSTLLGGRHNDRALGIATDTSGTAYIAGWTLSSTFPTTPGAYQRVYGGGTDAFVLRLSSDGSRLLYSTFVGGTGDDGANDIAVDTSGRAYIAGVTWFASFPTTSDAGRRCDPYSADAVLAVFDITGSTLQHATCVGGVGHDTANGIAIDRDNRVHMTGESTSVDLSTSTSTHQRTFGGGLSDTLVAHTGPFAAASQCDMSFSSASTTFSSDPGLSAVLLITGAHCPWSASSTAPWLEFVVSSSMDTTTSLVGRGPGHLTYVARRNVSSEVRRGAIVVNGRPHLISQHGTTASSHHRFVQLLYNSLLAREADAASLMESTSRLTSGAMSRTQLAVSMFSSEEFNLVERFIAGLYVGILGRDPEVSGWDFHRRRMRMGLVTQDTLVAQFLNAPEYTARFGSPSNADFVRLLFRNALGREAVVSEVSAWSSLLETNRAVRRDVAQAILNAPEFRSRTANRMNVFLLYAGLLARDPGPDGYREFLLYLSKNSLTAALHTFVTGPEFLARLGP